MIPRSISWKAEVALILVLLWSFPHFAFSGIRSHDKPVHLSPASLSTSKELSNILVSGFAFSQPARMLKETIHRVLEVVTEEELKKDAEQRRMVLRRVIHDRLNFNRFAQSTLQGHWQARTFAEKQRFVALLQKLLEQSFLQFIENYQEGTLHYLQESVKGEFALVKTRVVTPADTVSIDYRMVLENGEWQVFDFHIDGVSIARNYRAQFQKILKREPFQNLLDRLEDQTA
ncbi:MlaC/ttg2D family ABC transporter substrate-binding protein [Nitrospina gracilis]|uniref:MlaC/ttg2D family ABC transporter substrate-binding protein n=1 Tax=Nitrospina gracilis TaxID=35801 RepID=UPI001F25D4E0|nr:ABC transporter substrate-binding protein [Nitrospina gracilis]MCF8721398.1 phospholipid transport system substrate-binding protein [Nitrospina gracilis Nb-211]